MTTFRILWAIDGWGHRHLSRRMHRRLFSGICDWLDDELIKPTSPFHEGRP